MINLPGTEQKTSIGFTNVSVSSLFITGIMLKLAVVVKRFKKNLFS